MAENHLFINETSDKVQSTESFPDEDSILNRTFSDMNLYDCESRMSTYSRPPRPINSEIMAHFFSSLGRTTKIDSSDRLHDDLELNLQTDEEGLGRVFTESDWGVNSSMRSSLAFSQTDLTAYDPFANDAELMQRIAHETNESRNRYQMSMNNFYSKAEEPFEICSTSTETMHSILNKLESISNEASLASKYLNVDYDNATLMDDLTSVIHKLSDNRPVKDFFVWIVPEKNNRGLVCVNVIDEKSRSLLGSICIKQEQFQKARADGVFDKFLSIRLVETFDNSSGCYADRITGIV